MSERPVLVTGGAGFVGSHLCDRLLAEGHAVVAVDDLATGRRENLADAFGHGEAFAFTEMDVRTEGLLDVFARHRPEVVMHLAAQAGVRPSLEDPDHDASVNIMGTLNVLKCASSVGVSQGRLRRLGRHPVRGTDRACRSPNPPPTAPTRSLRTASARRWRSST